MEEVIICLDPIKEAQRHMDYLISGITEEDKIEALICIYNSLENLKKFAS